MGGVLEDWPRIQGHLEDKFWWPWPRTCLALALAWSLGLEEIGSTKFSSLMPQSCSALGQ